MPKLLRSISVVMPVFNGVRFLRRSIGSLLNQTSPDWELLAVDDASTDDSLGVLREYASRDTRIRVISMPTNGGPAMARNRALGEARAEWIAYLDCDDEFAPDHVERILKLSGQCRDAMVFRYDLVDQNGVTTAYDPAKIYPLNPRRNFSTPLGVAHRAELFEKVGGFDEELRYEADWDLWRRFEALGVRWSFVPLSSGKYHIRADSHFRSKAGDYRPDPLLPSRIPAAEKTRGLRLLFCSWHNYLDPGSGAASATRAALESLREGGWQCRAVCGSQMDFGEPVPLSDFFPSVGIRPTLQRADRLACFEACVDGVPVSMYVPESTADHGAFLDAVERTMREWSPDIVLTYGGNELQRKMQAVFRTSKARIVFALHNHTYSRPDLFADVDLVLTPSEFTRGHYRRAFCLDSVAVIWPWKREILDETTEARYVTFVNPQPNKGLAWWRGIARELNAIRPDIPLLVVRGRARSDDPLLRFSNVTEIPYTPSPNEFYSKSKLLLMPSLWMESFGRVAAEAMALGIPVLASDRGALPETMGDTDFSLTIPERFTPEAIAEPTRSEIEPWIRLIIRLWDDPAYYGHASERCLAHAVRWEPGTISDRLDEILRSVLAPDGCEMAPYFRRSNL